MLKEAMLYKKGENRAVSCFLCNHHCEIPDGKTGVCAVRENRGGTLYTTVYGAAVAAHVDPIEKKPIFHLAPGSTSFSFSTVGCNFRCGFCQNWEISQVKEAQRLGVDSAELAPQTIAAQAKKLKCRSISYTYTEPTIFFEYAYETALLAKEEGLYNVFVTNGYMTAEALEKIKPYLDAANVDLKAYSEDYYRKVCGAKLQGVLRSIEKMRELGIWVEVTTLVLPGMNDSREELERLARFIASVGLEIPWHISRFHPDYRMTDLESTPIATLKMAREIGKEAGLRYVYRGNVAEEENTHCYQCNALLVRRFGFSVLENRVRESKCPACGAPIDGIELGG
jgi:pyruvate formate lyase activating enzyme